MYVSTFHSSRITTRNWKMPTLVDFMESLTHEKDKIINYQIKITSPCYWCTKSIQRKEEIFEAKREREEAFKYRKL